MDFNSTLLAVATVEPTKRYKVNLREEGWSFALDQRAFGPRRLLVAFSDRKGRLLRLAHVRRTDPPEAALLACMEHAAAGAAAAVAYCDEHVVEGPPPADIPERFALAQHVAASYGVHLVDWIACDDDLFRSSRLVVRPGDEWWDVP